MPKHITYSAYYSDLAPGTMRITENIYDGLDLASFLEHPTEPIDIQISIEPGVIVQSNDAGKPAISTLGIPAGSTLTINNQGFIIGAGGRGGSQYDMVEPAPDCPEMGEPGGDAIYTTINTSIANAFGYIWSGGGGGALYWAGNPIVSSAGSGGAGRGPMGGGEGGVGGGQIGLDAIPFVSFASPGGAASTTLTNKGGAYAAQGTVGANNTASPPGEFWPRRQPGYAVNQAEGATLTWIDGQPVVARLKGATGARPLHLMHWRAWPKPYQPLLIYSDQIDFNLAEALGFPVEPVNTFVYIAPNVRLSASTTAKFAFSTEGMHPDSRLYIKIRGQIVGRGGRGGDDPALAAPDIPNPGHGQPGGDAMRLTIKTVIAVPSPRDKLNALPPHVLAGGGGGGYCRIAPTPENTVGGMGGAGGAGGLGTYINGTSCVDFMPTQLRSSPSTWTTLLTFANDYRGYSTRSSWWNESGKGGTYGCEGAPGKTWAYGDVAGTTEQVSGGEGGWAINTDFSYISIVAGNPEQMIRIDYQSNENHDAGTVQFFQGRGINRLRDHINMLYWSWTPKPLPLEVIPETFRQFITLNESHMEFNLYDYLGGPSQPLNVFVHVPIGVLIGSSSPDIPAVSTGPINASSTVTVTYEGTIAGCGGRGGGLDGYDPGTIFDVSVGAASRPVGNGGKGGPGLALKSGPNIRSRLLNSVFAGGPTTAGIETAGAILKGGGGGGGAAFTAVYSDITGNWLYQPDTVRCAFGGGGGAGGGKGGAGSVSTGGDGSRTLGWNGAGTIVDWGAGWTAQQSISGVLATTTASYGRGGYETASGTTSYTNASITQKINANGTWGTTKLVDIVACGSAGAGGVATVTF